MDKYVETLDALMKAKKEKIFICQEMDEILKQRVDHLVKISLIN